MVKPTSFPHTIEMGNGPSVIVYSQGEYDGFMEACDRNAQTLVLNRADDEAWPYIIALYRSDVERPEAPLGVAGPFATKDAAVAFARTWTERLAHPHVRVEASRLPSPAAFMEFMEDGYDVAVDEAEGSFR